MEFVDHCEITQVHQGAVDQVRQVLPPDERRSATWPTCSRSSGIPPGSRSSYALLRSQLCVCDIADLLGLTQSAISHQFVGSCGAASWSNSAGMARPSIIPWPAPSNPPHHQPGDGTRGKLVVAFFFIADTHVCLCPGRRGGPPGGGGGDRRASRCAFLEQACSPSNRVPSRPAVSGGLGGNETMTHQKF